MDTVKVAIIGFGTIGSGVARILLESNDRISRQVGKRVELVQVVDPNATRPTRSSFRRGCSRRMSPR